MNIFKLFVKRDYIMLLLYIAALIFAMYAAPYIAALTVSINNPFVIPNR